MKGGGKRMTFRAMRLSSLKNSLISKRSQIVFGAGIVFFLTLLTDIFATLKIGGLDDAYITYTFARNLAQGNGIVWSVGSAPVYGSTTFTYTILLALFGYFGFPIPMTSILLGAIFWGLSNVVLFLLIKDKIGVAPAFFAATLSAISLRALNLSWGMETGLYTFLVLSIFALYANNKYSLTSIAVVLLVMTRLDGLLVPAMIGGHFLITNSLPLKKRFAIFAKSTLPAMAILIPWAVFLYLYFGSILPNSFLAKRLFDSSVSGLFYPMFYWDIFLTSQDLIVLILTFAFLLVAGIGIVKAILHWRDARNLVFIWIITYVAMFALWHMPHSPWYYAPVIPVIYVAFVFGAKWVYSLTVNFIQSSGTYSMPSAMLVAQMILIVLIVQFIFTAQASYQQIEADRFGEHVYKNEERRVLGEVVLNDMTVRNITNTSLMAFEVGYLGYNIPGEVHDILGLVSPDVVKNGGMKNPTYILDKYKPEYAVIVDAYGYPPTAPIYQSFEFQSNYKELFSLPRSFGHNYKVFRREPFQMQKIWNFDLKKSAIAVHQIEILDNTDSLILESTGDDPYLVYGDFNTRKFTKGILCGEVYSSNPGIFEIFLNFGNHFDYENSLKFLLLSNSHTLCSRIPDGQSIFGVRIDPLNHAGNITIYNLSIWEPK